MSVEISGSVDTSTRVRLYSSASRSMICFAFSVLAAILLGGSAAPAKAAQTDLTLIAQQQLSPRLIELTLRTSALPADTKVRVLLPADYARSEKRYPVLYLFHGGLEDYTAWTDPAKGNAEARTAGLPLIVVMPDAGPFGYEVNWYNNGAFGPPLWETYHIYQLIPWIDAHYRTIARRGKRAMAGLSLGGHGAASYAARHPDLIGAAGSFSGALDENLPFFQASLAQVAGLLFGPYTTQEVRWRGINTLDLAANLTNTDVSMYVGDGSGPTDFETNLKVAATNVHDRLVDLGVPHLFEPYGTGEHTWTYFSRDFTDWLPHVMDYFARETEPESFTRVPKSFSYSSINPEYSVYDWTVQVQRPALEFSALEIRDAKRFSVIGSGTATVVTAPLYEPNGLYNITTFGFDGWTHSETRADRGGRLKLTLALGPGNPFQQYSPAADQASTGGGPYDAPFYIRGNGSRFNRRTVSVCEREDERSCDSGSHRIPAVLEAPQH